MMRLKGAEYLIITDSNGQSYTFVEHPEPWQIKERLGIHSDLRLRCTGQDNDGSLNYRIKTGYSFNVKPVGGTFPK